jgi:hypothetical protein
MERLAQWRMANLRLSGAPLERAEDVFHCLGAVQSQDFGPAKWSVGQRVVGGTDTSIERLFDEGGLLRTHVLRATWHFVLPEDIRWMLQITGPRVHAGNAYMYRRLELDDEALATSRRVIEAALEGGAQLTRKEVERELTAAGIGSEGFRLGYILMNAELGGLICSGARRGRQQTYALLEERVPRAESLTADEALARLTLRYFTSHGPATAKDFSWWSSLTLTEIRRGLAMVGSQLEQEVIDGLTYWFAPSMPPPPEPSTSMHLLQGYDEYIVGYSESKFLLAIGRSEQLRSLYRPVYNGVILFGSQVAGYWKRTIQKDALVVEAALFAPLDAAQTQALADAADRMGEFLGLPATAVRSLI